MVKANTARTYAHPVPDSNSIIPEWVAENNSITDKVVVYGLAEALLWSNGANSPARSLNSSGDKRKAWGIGPLTPGGDAISDTEVPSPDILQHW